MDRLLVLFLYTHELTFFIFSHFISKVVHLETSSFVNFMIQILSHKFNGVHIGTSFKILNEVAVCTLLDL
jgi:hypothetical protein